MPNLVRAAAELGWNCCPLRLQERNAVIDGDTYFLHVAERLLVHDLNGDWKRHYYMPANADSGVIAWRQW